tara:strand:- start:320 stop:544 length:225 start_codon:yes stop_codon:yes gene_type:complete
MKLEILRPVMISGEPADAGSILEVENSAAVTLIGLGKAIEHKQEAVACPAKPPAEEEAPSCPPKKPTTRKRTKE